MIMYQILVESMSENIAGAHVYYANEFVAKKKRSVKKIRKVSDMCN